MSENNIIFNTSGLYKATRLHVATALNFNHWYFCTMSGCSAQCHSVYSAQQVAAK